MNLNKYELLVISKQFGDYTGATIATQNLLAKLSGTFKKIKVLTMKTNVENTNDKIEVFLFHGEKGIANYLKKSSGSLCVGYSDDHLGYLFSKANIKYVHTYHGNWPEARWTNLSFFLKSFYFIALYKRTLANSSHVVCVSEKSLMFVQQNNKQSSIIYNGIKQNIKSRQTRKNDSSTTRIIMVGNVDSRKYKYMLKMLQSGLVDLQKLDVCIYGKIISEKISAKLSTYNNIHVMGMQKAINYSKFDLLLCTSSSENLPISIVEAVSSNLPVLSFDVGGIKEVLKRVPGNMPLVKKGDIFNMASELSAFMGHETTINGDMVRKVWNWDYASKEYSRIFQKLEGV